MMHKKIQIPALHNVHVFVGSWAQVQAWVHRQDPYRYIEYDGKTEGCAFWFKTDDGFAYSCVWFPNRRPGVDVIAHEACHVFDHLCEILGIKTADRELRALVTGYIAGKLWALLR